MGSSCDELDGDVGLRVRDLPDRYRSAVEDLAASGDRGFAFAAELANACAHSRSRADMASLNAD